MFGEFFQTFAAGLAVAGICAIAGFLFRSDRRSMRTAARLEAHEKTCADRYGEISEELKNAATSRREMRELMVAQDKNASAHREAVAISQSQMRETLARLDENLRMRERAEDKS